MIARGFTLIEVLVSALILGLGFLGLSAMQTHSLKTNHNAIQRSQAVMLANFMMDSMRANKEAAENGRYNLGSDTNPECVAPTGSDLIKKDQQLWFTALKEALGEVDTTCGFVACNIESCIVKVYWDESRSGGVIDQNIEITSQL